MPSDITNEPAITATRGTYGTMEHLTLNIPTAKTLASSSRIGSPVSVQ